MILHENRLPADDSREIPCLICYFLKKKKKQNLKLSSAANYRWRLKGLCQKRNVVKNHQKLYGLNSIQKKQNQKSTSHGISVCHHSASLVHDKPNGDHWGDFFFQLLCQDRIICSITFQFILSFTQSIKKYDLFIIFLFPVR